MNILYLTHDLSDPAVAKRVMMLRDGGAVVTVAGFRRTEEPPKSVAGAVAVDLGRTYNGGFVQRILAVLREVFLVHKRRELFTQADVVIARNLEMLALGVRGRKTNSVLVYESLDIHRLLLKQGLVGKVLRGLEGWLSRRASALITSSPAFVRCYFETMSCVRLPLLLLENKVYEAGFSGDVPFASRPSAPPWRIGWFGAIRCSKSLDILSELVRRSGGLVEVIIRGRPAYDQIPDFDSKVKATKGLCFEGAYKNPDDLAAIYRDVHFTWAVDMFEEGLNSSWLLPNRLYEGGLYHSVPLALKAVETGHFLDERGIGVTFDNVQPEALLSFFQTLTMPDYQSLQNKSEAVSRNTWLATKEDCVTLVKRLESFKSGCAL